MSNVCNVLISQSATCCENKCEFRYEFSKTCANKSSDHGWRDDPGAGHAFFKKNKIKFN